MSMSCLRIKSSSRSRGPSYTWPTVTANGNSLVWVLAVWGDSGIQTYCGTDRLVETAGNLSRIAGNPGIARHRRHRVRLLQGGVVRFVLLNGQAVAVNQQRDVLP